MHEQLARKSAFTLFELLVACALLGILFFWLLRTPQRLHNQFVRVAATHLHILLTHQCERARTEQASLQIMLPPLPAQVQFGAPTGAQGPPSKQTTPITSVITMPHTKNKGCPVITATPAGTLPPGTVYLTNKERNEGYALSSTMKSSCPVRCYRWTGRSWSCC